MRIFKKLALAVVALCVCSLAFAPVYASSAEQSVTSAASQGSRSFGFGEEMRGKAFVFYGDSITARLGLYFTDKDYIQLLQEEFGFYAYNGAVSGATYTVHSSTSNHVFSQLSKSQILCRDADYVSVFLGTNDFGSSRALGSMSDPAGTDTVYAAIKQTLNDIIELNPDAKIMLLTPLWRGDAGYAGFDSKNPAGYTLADVRDAVTEVGNAFGCKVVDLTDVITADNAGTHLNGDRLHVKPAGYRAIADKIKNS